jgi:hypothetical protein
LSDQDALPHSGLLKGPSTIEMPLWQLALWSKSDVIHHSESSKLMLFGGKLDGLDGSNPVRSSSQTGLSANRLASALEEMSSPRFPERREADGRCGVRLRKSRGRVGVISIQRHILNFIVFKYIQGKSFP